jgi:hypothetical protein
MHFIHYCFTGHSMVATTQVYPHGSTDSLPYCTMGSGSLNAMAVFEASYKEDMTQQEAEALVARAIRSGTSPCTIKGLQRHLNNVIAKSQVQRKCLCNSDQQFCSQRFIYQQCYFADLNMASNAPGTADNTMLHCRHLQ